MAIDFASALTALSNRNGELAVSEAKVAMLRVCCSLTLVWLQSNEMPEQREHILDALRSSLDRCQDERP
jgi:hypothetical protein